MTEPTHAELIALWKVCKGFVEKQEISCADTIHQCGWVIEHAYEFIEDVCNVVGYVEYKDEE